MSEPFVIESVEMRPLDKSLYPPGEDPPFDYRMVLFARTPDGNAFYNEQWITQELLDDRGEEQLKQWMREMAVMPDTPPPPHDTQ